MDPFLVTMKDIEEFPLDLSDPSKKANPPAVPEPLPCLAGTASGEGSQPESAQSQNVISLCPNIPGTVLTQNSAKAPGTALDTNLEETTELFSMNQPETSLGQSRSTADDEVTDVTDIPKTSLTDHKLSPVPASTMTISNARRQQVKTLSGDQTVGTVQKTPSHGCQMKMPNDDKTVNESQWPMLRGGHNVTLSGDQIFSSQGQMVIIGDQFLSALGHKIIPTSDQNFGGAQMTTFGSMQTHCGFPSVSHQSLSTKPALLHLPGCPLIQEQVSAKNRSQQTQSSGFQNKPECSRAYICPYEDCGKSYSRPHHLRIHKRSHTGEKPYACREPGCTWKFPRSDELKRHMQTHTGERPYRCTLCNKNFVRLDHLKQHGKVHR